MVGTDINRNIDRKRKIKRPQSQIMSKLFGSNRKIKLNYNRSSFHGGQIFWIGFFWFKSRTFETKKFRLPRFRNFRRRKMILKLRRGFIVRVKLETLDYANVIILAPAWLSRFFPTSDLRFVLKERQWLNGVLQRHFFTTQNSINRTRG